MIIEGLLDIFYSLVNAILTPIDTLSLNFAIGNLQPVLQYFKMLFYILPLARLLPIVAFIGVLMSFRIAISLLKTLWGILPLV